MSPRLPRWLLPVVLTLALAVGLGALVQQFVNEGGGYPPYSTFRADPFGTKALFLALKDLPGQPIAVTRSFRPLKKLLTDAEGGDRDLGETTVILLGEGPRGWASSAPPRSRIERIEELARAGARVVVAFEPIKKLLVVSAGIPFGEAKVSPNPGPSPSPAQSDPRDDSRGNRSRKKANSKDPSDDDESSPLLGEVAPLEKDFLGARWGLALNRVKPPKSEGRPSLFDRPFSTDDTAATTPASATLPAETGKAPLPWLTALDFEIRPSDKPLWRVAYTRGHQPVVAEREFGCGSLVLCSDTYFLSNEALFRDANPRALVWLIGRGRQVVFDEFALGTREDPGLMTLANRYNLTGIVVAFVLLALLYVWRNASSLVPPPPDPGFAGAPPQTGLGADAGFPSLLRRAVPAPALPQMCLDQWKATSSGLDGRSSPNPDRILRLQETLAGSDPKKDPAGAYRRMRDALASARAARPK